MGATDERVEEHRDGAPAFVDAVVLWARDAKATATFYRRLGVPLVLEQHEDGPVHLACELGPVHFAIYEGDGEMAVPGRGAAGGAQLGLRVDRLDALSVALEAEGVDVVVPVETVPWGRRMVVRDPDGRMVELNAAR